MYNENTETSCSVSVPSEVSSSKGKQNSTYKGVVDSTSSMGSTSLTISANKTYYANYSSALNIYRPSAASGTNSVAKITAYRNEYFTSTTAMGSVISTANNNTTEMASISGLMSGATFAGYSTSVNTSTIGSGLNTIQSIKDASATTYYVIATYTTDVTATFYYSKAADGTTASKTSSGTQTRNVYCSSTSAATSNVNSNGTISAPSITDEVVPTGTTRVSNWATANSNMSTTSTLNTGTTKYYAVYRTEVTIYYPSSASAATNKKVYRNAFLNTATPTVGTTKYTTVLASGTTGTTDNATAPSAVSGYTLIGYANATSTNTVTYADLNAIKISAATSVYAVNSKEESVTATFSYSKAADGPTASKTSSGTKTTYLRCTSTTAAGTNVSNGTISAPSITDEVVPTGTTRVSDWATANSNMSTTSTLNTGTTKYYAVPKHRV